jgi:hypothetical protein
MGEDQAMSECHALGHSWEVFSGDYMTCSECGAEGMVVVNKEDEEED